MAWGKKESGMIRMEIGKHKKYVWSNQPRKKKHKNVSIGAQEIWGRLKKLGETSMGDVQKQSSVCLEDQAFTQCSGASW